MATGIVDFGDEVTKHGLGHFKIRDDAVLHGTDGLNVAGRAAKHPLGVLPHGEHHAVAARILLDGYDRRLAQDNTLPLHIDAGIGGSKVDGEIVGKGAEDEIH